MRARKLISFDWALKRLLRSKANFEILEGFLSELLNDNIKILEILESEANKENVFDKFNRVDLKVKDQNQAIIIIELQYDKELDYLQRILYGTSKVITEHMQQSRAYENVVKVISVNILYFDLGHGTDYIYHGTTSFIGIHNHDKLSLTDKQKKLYPSMQIESVFPEYYLIKVNKFDDIAKNTLDEWVYFFKNEEIKDSFQAKGLKQAKEELDILKLSETERQAYESYQDDLHYQASMYESSYGIGHYEGREEGKEEGRKEGREEGKEEGRKEGIEQEREVNKNDKRQIIQNMRQAKIDIKIISQITGSSVEEINKILDKE